MQYTIVEPLKVTPFLLTKHSPAPPVRYSSNPISDTDAQMHRHQPNQGVSGDGQLHCMNAVGTSSQCRYYVQYPIEVVRLWIGRRNAVAQGVMLQA